jgi:hypothetical protein
MPIMKAKSVASGAICTTIHEPMDHAGEDVAGEVVAAER